MDIQKVIAELKAERDRIDHAILALTGARKSGRGPGRRPGSLSSSGAKGRTMSPAARKRISATMKFRWAQIKKKPKQGGYPGPRMYP